MKTFAQINVFLFFTMHTSNYARLKKEFNGRFRIKNKKPNVLSVFHLKTF